MDLLVRVVEEGWRAWWMRCRRHWPGDEPRLTAAPRSQTLTSRMRRAAVLANHSVSPGHRPGQSLPNQVTGGDTQPGAVTVARTPLTWSPLTPVVTVLGRVSQSAEWFTLHPLHCITHPNPFMNHSACTYRVSNKKNGSLPGDIKCKNNFLSDTLYCILLIKSFLI